MKYLKKLKVENIIVFIVILIFFAVNLLFLTNFPFVHSDEAWLSGLSRNILEEKELSVTEPFFDLYPRHPHAVKILFHLMQMAFIKLMGYNIFTFRFISLLAGTASLYFFYKLTKNFTNSKFLAAAAAIMMAVDIQNIYASHFARQEIILVLILLIALYYFLNKFNYKKPAFSSIVMGLILGAGVGIHPNSFVIALPFIFIYTYYLVVDEKFQLRNYLIFGGTLGLIALFFVLLSFSFDSNFITNYAGYGQSLGVFSSILTKIDRLDYFYQKLYYGVSGTYYTPPIKFQFIMFALALICAISRLIYRLSLKNSCQVNYKKDNQVNNKNDNKNSKNIMLLLMFLGINTGYVLIGRYNQTGIIFIFPICYLLILHILSSFRKKYSQKYSYIITLLIIAVLAFNTTSTFITATHFNYDDYLAEIAKTVDKSDMVLANLNAEYYFNNGKLLDYRNLAYLEENDLSFSEYIETNNIEYIIYPEEMDFIYNTRPVWNILYGNLYPYYQDMKNYLDENCTMVHSFANRTYGMRIARYVGEKEWKVKIYQTEE